MEHRLEVRTKRHKVLKNPDIDDEIKEKDMMAVSILPDIAFADALWLATTFLF